MFINNCTTQKIPLIFWSGYFMFFSAYLFFPTIWTPVSRVFLHSFFELCRFRFVFRLSLFLCLFPLNLSPKSHAVRLSLSQSEAVRVPLCRSVGRQRLHVHHFSERIENKIRSKLAVTSQMIALTKTSQHRRSLTQQERDLPINRGFCKDILFRLLFIAISCYYLL